MIMLWMLANIENFAVEVNWSKILLRQIIMPAILKQPTVVILFMFFVSVTTMVKVGSKPKNNTTTAGKTLNDMKRSKVNQKTF